MSKHYYYLVGVVQVREIEKARAGIDLYFPGHSAGLRQTTCCPGSEYSSRGDKHGFLRSSTQERDRIGDSSRD